MMASIDDLDNFGTGDGETFRPRQSKISVQVAVARDSLGASLMTKRSGPADTKSVPFECGPLKGVAIMGESPHLEMGDEGVAMAMELTVILAGEPSIADILDAFVAGMEIQK